MKKEQPSIIQVWNGQAVEEWVLTENGDYICKTTDKTVRCKDPVQREKNRKT